jgi:hypothetical protein
LVFDQATVVFAHCFLVEGVILKNLFCSLGVTFGGGSFQNLFYSLGVAFGGGSFCCFASFFFDYVHP